MPLFDLETPLPPPPVLIDPTTDLERGIKMETILEI
jgi:hypothetical protein